MRLLESSEFEVCRTLKSLVEIGLIEIEMPSAMAADDLAGRESDLGETVEEAPPAPKSRRTRREAPEATNGHEATNGNGDGTIDDAAAELRELAESERDDAVDEIEGTDADDPEFKEALVKFLSSVRDA